MKKLVLLLAVVFSVSLFSCGNKAAETTTEPAAEEVAVVEEEVAVVEADSANAEVEAPADSAAVVAE